MTLVYLGNKVFRDNTISKKGPPTIQFKQELPKSSHTQPQKPTTTPREEQQKQQDERKALEAQEFQESTDSESTQVYTQESHDESEKEKKINPLPVQKNVRRLKRLEL